MQNTLSFALCLTVVCHSFCSAANADEFSKLRSDPRFSDLTARFEALKKQQATTKSQNQYRSPSYSSSSSNRTSSSAPGDLRLTPMELVPAYPNVRLVTGKSEDNPELREGALFGETTFGMPTAKGCKQRAKHVKFYTNDQPNLVYNFYVRYLQKNHWRFTDTKTAGEINAKNPAAKLTVLIRYEKLPRPYSGTAVAITHVWTSTVAADTISIGGESPDMGSSQLSLLD